MTEVIGRGVYMQNGVPVFSGEGLPDPIEGKTRTIAHSILRSHSKKGDKLLISFDALTSHDITYVGIIQTARGSGLTSFPVPYAMTNCHNSLCAVGGTINEDDHVFGLSAAKKYGGIYVPANVSVIHMFARECLAKCGDMILGSDSHTRYGALGTMGIGEGGPEVVKQLLSNTYDIDMPEVIMVYLEGEPNMGVGPHDVALALIKATFSSGFVKNKVLEFIGPGVKNLSADFRCGIDVMTTETACLSSIWQTDDVIEQYYKTHGRQEAYRELKPLDGAYYDGMIRIDLSSVECMIALPYHPSNAYTINELNANLDDILASVDKESRERFGLELGLINKIKDGRLVADQGVIAGCAGGLFDNIRDAAKILEGGSIGDGYFSLSVYPGSAPVNLELTRNGVLTKLMEAGALIKPAFCGPCFGAGDVPSNGALSLRHTTRNFPNREGSKPKDGQLSAVALMDARSIAATALNKGVLTPASDIGECAGSEVYRFDKGIYDKRVYNGFGNPKPDEELRLGPNITDWPKLYPLSKHLLLELTAVIHDDVTTTDELIPSGETSSYRSNPLKLAEFALSRRCPEYVGRCKRVMEWELVRRNEREHPERIHPELIAAFNLLGALDCIGDTAFGSAIFANKPGDGSAREQAASCQRVLGGLANICYEYATKRYRSNCINWGMLPFTLLKGTDFDYKEGDMVFVPNIREAIKQGKTEIPAKVSRMNGTVDNITLIMDGLTDDERDIILEGCLMNYYASKTLDNKG